MHVHNAARAPFVNAEEVVALQDIAYQQFKFQSTIPRNHAGVIQHPTFVGGHLRIESMHLTDWTDR